MNALSNSICSRNGYMVWWTAKELSKAPEVLHKYQRLNKIEL